MKLVLCYEDTDGFTYSCSVTLPLEYASAEDAIVDFELAAKEAQTKSQAAEFEFNGYFEFSGHMFYYGTFFHESNYFGPDFYTVDEWFRKHGQVPL